MFSSNRASIIQELTHFQERDGWLSDESLREVSERLGVPLHRVEGLSTFYTHFRRQPPKPVRIDVCRDLSCMLAGADTHIRVLEEEYCEHPDVEICPVSCLGRCEDAPAASCHHGVFQLSDPSALAAALAGTLEESPARSGGPWAADIYDSAEEHYATLRKILAGDRSAALSPLEESGLRGMGGAGFPTGVKWKLVSAEAATPRYVICNADESEPGTFKDRQILHDLPHLVIEGMLLAGYTVDSNKGWIFIRHEYEPERQVIERALDTARERGVLGTDILGSGFDFDIEVFVSPGGYILGEETALIECMEDKRGEPRNKPPFPGTVGLDGQPTLMNNVETFAHTVGILGNGTDWWHGLGRGDHSGHKFISVSGDVEKPGVYLIPMGAKKGTDGIDLYMISPTVHEPP